LKPKEHAVWLLVIDVSLYYPRGRGNPLRSMQNRSYGPPVDLPVYIEAVCRMLPLREIYTHCKQ